MTAIEVLGSRVEGEMVIVSLKPAMQSIPDLKSGLDDLESFEVEWTHSKTELSLCAVVYSHYI